MTCIPAVARRTPIPGRTRRTRPRMAGCGASRTPRAARSGWRQRSATAQPENDASPSPAPVSPPVLGVSGQPVMTYPPVQPARDEDPGEAGDEPEHQDQLDEREQQPAATGNQQ